MLGDLCKIAFVTLGMAARAHASTVSVEACREFDVIAAAVVIPEPAGAGVGMLALLGIAAVRRR